MSMYEPDISWAMTAGERRGPHRQLSTDDEVRGVFLTAHDDVLAVLYEGEHRGFDERTRALAPESSVTLR